MQLAHLINFLMVAKLGSFTKAADALYVTQPAMTKSIATLEKELGVKLFYRKGKTVTISVAGQQILPYVQTITDGVDRIKSICGTLEEGKQKVTFKAGVVAPRISELAHKFRKLHPEILLSSQKHDSGTADITIEMTISDEFTDSQIHLLREDLVLIVPSNHPLAGTFEIDLIQLAEYPIISLTERAMLRRAEDHFCKLAGFTPCRQKEILTHVDLDATVHDEAGVVFFPSKTWYLDSIDNDRIVRIRNPDCYRNVYAEISSGSERPAVRTFFDHIVSFFSQL